jgi:hypothetical protein
MLTSTHIQEIQSSFKRPALIFVFSLAFLPLPVVLGGSFLREMLGRIQSIFTFGLGVGDLLLMTGMSIGVILLIVVPLAGFAWGQVLAWARKEYSSNVLLAYACLSIVYLIVSASIIRSSLG